MTNLQRSNCALGLRNGLTLIEVVASLVLMGTLLVAVILGASSHLRQLRQAQRKTAALATLDRLLSNWSHQDFSQQSLPECAEMAGVRLRDEVHSMTGRSRAPNARIAEADTMCVGLQTRPLALASGLNLEIVRLEVVTDGDALDKGPLTWVEVIRAARPIAGRSR